jgi:hypothetical protein
MVGRGVKEVEEGLQNFEKLVYTVITLRRCNRQFSNEWDRCGRGGGGRKRRYSFQFYKYAFAVIDQICHGKWWQGMKRVRKKVM